MDENVKTSDQVKIFLNKHCIDCTYNVHIHVGKTFILVYLFKSEDKIEPLISEPW